MFITKHGVTSTLHRHHHAILTETESGGGINVFCFRQTHSHVFISFVASEYWSCLKNYSLSLQLYVNVFNSALIL
jgi:hypothetical protein